MQDGVYFGPLDAEMQGSGPAALLKYLKEYPLHTSKLKMPKTQATSDQINHTIESSRANPFYEWFSSCYYGEHFIGGRHDPVVKWVQGKEINKKDLYDWFFAWCKDRGINEGVILRKGPFAKYLAKYIVGTGAKGSRPYPEANIVSCVGRFVVRMSGYEKLKMPNIYDARKVLNDSLPKGHAYDIGPGFDQKTGDLGLDINDGAATSGSEYHTH
jgi:hypothetical protein